MQKEQKDAWIASIKEEPPEGIFHKGIDGGINGWRFLVRLKDFYIESIAPKHFTAQGFIKFIEELLRGVSYVTSIKYGLLVASFRNDNKENFSNDEQILSNQEWARQGLISALVNLKILEKHLTKHK